MTDPARPSRFHFFNNWISLAGVIVALGAGFSFFMLFAIDMMSGHSNPYLGILTYLASPAFLILGLSMMALGWWIQRQRSRQGTGSQPSLSFSIDLANPKDRKRMLLFTGGTFVFLILSAVGSYQTYHVTESVVFCGEVCHTVMEPEYVTYQRGAHARVSCVACHIGSGAEWYVKSKLSGLYQVYSVAFNKYATPIPTPVHNLRPAEGTCEQCHWPQRFSGDLDRTYERYLMDDDNTAYTVRLSLHVGGGDPAKGPVTGIHWHTSPEHKVEYLATDEKRLEIPYMRVTGPDGEITEYSLPGFERDPALPLRTMDCMDCHNRPAHVHLGPSDAVSQAFSRGWLDRGLTNVKYRAMELLLGEYETREQALATIAAGLTETYADHASLPRAIEVLQEIYATNFFPVMKSDWSVYPNHIGHKEWPGCFRCHSDQHETPTGKVLSMSNCSQCHDILAQGSTEEELNRIHPAGAPFEHPMLDVSGMACHECHDGGMMLK